jgi:hypothetical protein
MTYSENYYKTPYFKIWLVCIIGCLFFGSIQGQTTLGAGDIAITGYNQHSHDVNANWIYKNGQFSFVLLVDIATGTEIKFTDRGWRGSAFVSGSNNEEGVLTWTSTGAMSGGTQIVITIDHSIPYGLPTATQGNVTSAHNFKLKEKKGDQILAYQGSSSSPTFLFAVNWHDKWSGANKKEETEVPTGLTEAINALRINDEEAHAQYNCSVEQNASLILVAIANTGNWTLETHIGYPDYNGNWLTLGNCNFSLSVTTTWNGNSWDYGSPNSSKEAIIDGDYDTSTEGEFSANSVTVTMGNLLEISDHTCLEIENNITVLGSLKLRSKGSIIQHSSIATVLGSGSIQAYKNTAPMNNYYEYTYWSSPVSSETIGGGLAESQPNSRYSFSAANFVDATMETNNNNAAVPGQDFIDDNGDDWLHVSNSTLMTPGVGYASMHASDTFSGENSQYEYIFEGSFNNGTIPVTISRNDTELNDLNWNLIGNPYPSAIDVDLFFAVNSYIAAETSLVTYDASNGNNYFDTGVDGVIFGSISSSDSYNKNNNGYEDFTNTANTTEVIRGTSYDLSVKINTDGYYTSHTFVWIDWNRDGDFSDTGETYDLGEDTDIENQLTSSSPFSIEVPMTAVIGTTRMRVSSKYYENPTSTERGFDGEVEDYSIVVNSSGSLDQAIYLWSQNTPHSSDNNGNEGSNFSTSDYAVINASGETAGGDGIIPDRYIPTMQGFFVSYNNNASFTSSSGNVAHTSILFNNSMRVCNQNNQFFRTSSEEEKNKLWLNLTSDNGVFNQILVSYLEGATDQDDGMSFDAPKNTATEAAAILYSTTADTSNKYVIQGKALESMNEDEIISIGYKTSIDVPTVYTLSIEKFEGTFLNNNPIYIKDKMLNELHNLKERFYSFTSETGEFNDRFEIVFKEEALSLDTVLTMESSLLIIEHLSGEVQFKYQGTSVMKSIEIFDLLGRKLYHFYPQSNDETFRVSRLSTTLFVARVTLDNNAVFTKKAIKK